MPASHQDRQLSDSFLVRCWVEPREATEQPEVVRVYVRNLRTGEEHYLNETSQLGDLVERVVHRAASEAAANDRDREAEAG